MSWRNCSYTEEPGSRPGVVDECACDVAVAGLVRLHQHARKKRSGVLVAHPKGVCHKRLIVVALPLGADARAGGEDARRREAGRFEIT